MAENTLHVKDFGALPDDGKEDSQAIQRAIEQAIKEKKSCLEFDAGTYLVSDINTQSPSNSKKVCLLINHADSGLCISGKIDDKGKPSTVLLFNKRGQEFYEMDYWIWVQGGKNIQFKNLLIDFPGAMAAGEIIEIKDDKTRVKLFPNVFKPRQNWKNAYIYHYDIASGLVHERIVDLDVQINPDKHEIIIQEEIGNLGDGLCASTQHHHAPSHTFMAHLTEGLSFQNIKVAAALGHAFVPVACKDITIRDFAFDPAARGKNRGWCSRRDGFTMRACKGKLLIEDSAFQYNSDDSLAFWGWTWYIKEVISDKKIRAGCVQNAGDYFLDLAMFLEKNEAIQFYLPLTEPPIKLSGEKRRIANFQFIKKKDPQKKWSGFYAEEITKIISEIEYIIEFDQKLPDFVLNNAEISFIPESSYFSDVIIRRIISRNQTNHRGVLIQSPNILVENSVFGHWLYLTSPYDFNGVWHGGPGIWNTEIRNNLFYIDQLHGGNPMGGIRLTSAFSTEKLPGIKIHHNTFYQWATIKVDHCAGAEIYNNHFLNISNHARIQVNENYKQNIKMRNNTSEMFEESFVYQPE